MVAHVIDLPSRITFLQHGWLSANCIVVKGEPTVLIDCGHVREVAETERRLRAATGLSWGDIDVLWLTHAHSDHAGGARVAQEQGAETWAHPITAKRVNAWDERALWVSYCNQIHARFTVDREIEEGVSIRLGDISLQTVHTPGHASGMTALYCPEFRLLISADALWENGFGPLNPFTETADVLEEQRATIARLGQLDVDLVLPGHGAPFQDCFAACCRAMSRLDAYADDRRRLARHACKGYFIHHLLEVGGMSAADALGYLQGVPCYQEFAARYFPDVRPEAVFAGMIQELLGRGAVAEDGGRLFGVGVTA